MADLAIPFSLSDILERVIPGGLLISAVAFGFYPPPADFSQALASPLAYVAFLAGSYALGVSVNSLGSFLTIKRYREYWSATPTEMEAVVRKAVEDHFAIKADDRSWRLCYGTVIKNGYGANTQLFLGLDVFCRAMTVASVLSGIVFLWAFDFAWLHYRMKFFPLLCAAISLLSHIRI